MILSLWTEKKKSSQSKRDENDFNHCILNWLEERERPVRVDYRCLKQNLN